VGMACGAGMPSIAILATALHVVALLLFTPVVRRLEPHRETKELEVRLDDMEGSLSDVMELAEEKGYQLELKSTTTSFVEVKRSMIVKFQIARGPKMWKLAEELSKHPYVSAIQMSDKAS